MIGPGGKLQNSNMKKVGGGTYISPSAFAQSGVAATTTMKLSEQGRYLWDHYRMRTVVQLNEFCH